MTHYERQNVEALGKLRVLEPQLALNESEYQKLAKEVSKVERKNRALIETQRHYERKRMQLDSDLEVFIEISYFCPSTSIIEALFSQL